MNTERKEFFLNSSPNQFSLMLSYEALKICTFLFIYSLSQRICEELASQWQDGCKSVEAPRTINLFALILYYIIISKEQYIYVENNINDYFSQHFLLWSVIIIIIITKEQRLLKVSHSISQFISIQHQSAWFCCEWLMSLRGWMTVNYKWMCFNCFSRNRMFLLWLQIDFQWIYRNWFSHPFCDCWMEQISPFW